MQIIYTRHARQRMRQRNVTEMQVTETLEMPDEIKSGDAGEEIAIKRYGNRELRVVYEEVAANTFVIYTVIKPKIPRSGRM